MFFPCSLPRLGQQSIVQVGWQRGGMFSILSVFLCLSLGPKNEVLSGRGIVRYSYSVKVQESLGFL